MRVREGASHLLDISGDSCHHSHNASKKFCGPLKKFFSDIYTDFRWSADQRESLEDSWIGVFYLTILKNLSKFNSTNIHLLFLCHSPDLRQFGFSSVLKPFIDDLKLLESDSGITFDINSKNVTLWVSIAAVCAHSLACHSLFGFLSPSAKHFCPSRLVSREQLQTEFQINKFTKCNKVLHNQHLQQSSVNNAASLSGVSEDSMN